MKARKWREKAGTGLAIVATLVIAAVLTQCGPGREPAGNGNLNELRAQLESVRKERDSLLEKLDASTRERVDLDGEINRLRQELERLKRGE